MVSKTLDNIGLVMQSQNTIWNGDWSTRQEDSSPSECHFQFFCKKCQLDVTMSDGRQYENDDGILSFKLKCPICGKWSWIH